MQTLYGNDTRIVRDDSGYADTHPDNASRCVATPNGLWVEIGEKMTFINRQELASALRVVHELRDLKLDGLLPSCMYQVDNLIT